MKKNKKILVVGRAGLDLYAHPINTPIENASQFTSQLGGSAANIAAGLAIQGNNVDLMSPISNDAEYNVFSAFFLSFHDPSL